jgi:hypothetical protein
MEVGKSQPAAFIALREASRAAQFYFHSSQINTTISHMIANNMTMMTSIMPLLIADRVMVRPGHRSCAESLPAFHGAASKLRSALREHFVDLVVSITTVGHALR